MNACARQMLVQPAHMALAPAPARSPRLPTCVPAARRLGRIGRYWGPQYAGMPVGGGGGRSRDAQVVNGDEVKLFVGGLPTEFGELELRSIMQPYGNVVDVHIMKPSGFSNQVRPKPLPPAAGTHPLTSPPLRFAQCAALRLRHV